LFFILLDSAAIIFIFSDIIDLKHFENVVYNPTMKPIKIDTTGDIIWKVPNGAWNKRKGQAMVSLCFDRVPGLRNEDIRREARPLRLIIEAYVIQKNSSRNNRLIKDWYFVTDEPFSEKGSSL